MHRNLAILSSLAIVVSALGAIGCSSKTTPAVATCDPTAPVSFKTDVLPVFQKSCTLSSVCHGQMNNAAEESLYLGENSGVADTDPNAVYAQLVGVDAKEIPSMKLVAAGDIDNSFVWHKMNNTQDTLASECSKATMMCSDCTSSTPCGGLMPYLGSVVEPDFLCTIQGWISQGAKND